MLALKCLAPTIQEFPVNMFNLFGLPSGLLISKGDIWRRGRRTLSPTFSAMKMKMVSWIVNVNCELLYVITPPESLITMIQSNYFNHTDIWIELSMHFNHSSMGLLVFSIAVPIIVQAVCGWPQKEGFLLILVSILLSLNIILSL